jgi:membrane-associated protein
VTSIVLLGYFLGETFPALGKNIDYAVLVILAFSIIPVAYEWRKHRRNGRANRAVDAQTTEPTKAPEAEPESSTAG